MAIFVSGSLAYDIILDYPGRFADHISLKKIHVLSLSFLVQSVKKTVGGTAGNIAYGLAMLGVKPALLSAVGEDGRAILKQYKDMSIDIRLSKISKQPTAAAYIMTDSADNQITGFHPGAMMEEVRLPKAGKNDWAIIAAENPANMERLARHYQKNKIRYIFDPGQAITALSKSQMRECALGAAILIGNDYEMSLTEELLKHAKNLRSKIFGMTRIRTFGSKGSEIVYPNGKKVRIGTAKVKKAVDPTGAGDSYRAGLVCGIVKGFDLKLSCQLGATAAAFAVERYGTQNHRFDYGILRARHNKNFSSKL